MCVCVVVLWWWWWWWGGVSSTAEHLLERVNCQIWWMRGLWNSDVMFDLFDSVFILFMTLVVLFYIVYR